jgi:RNA polymerase sigma-70 factor (ECF subfamily)
MATLPRSVKESGHPSREGALSDSTATSFLNRLKDGDEQALKRLLEAYSRLILTWCQRLHVSAADSEDVLQEVVMTALRKIGPFEKQHQRGSFRGWLHQITRLKVLEQRRRNQGPPAVGGSSFHERLAEYPADPAEDATDEHATDDRRILVRGALEAVRSEFAESTWMAAWRCLVDGLKPAAVAQEMGLKASVVSVAKYRVARRLREALADLAL